MKYIKQFLIILTVSLIGELLKSILPIPIPASIYGIGILFTLLQTKVIKLKDVEETGNFLLEIMPIMFIPAGVGIIVSWSSLKYMLLALIVIVVVSTITVLVTTAKLSDLIIDRRKNE